MLIPVHSSVDLISLANVASYLEANGQRVKSKSQVLATALQIVDESAFGKSPRFTVEARALDYLASLGIGISSENKQQAKKVNKLSGVVVPVIMPKECILSDDEALRQEALRIAQQCDQLYNERTKK